MESGNGETGCVYPRRGTPETHTPAQIAITLGTGASRVGMCLPKNGWATILSSSSAPVNFCFAGPALVNKSVLCGTI